MRLSLMIFLLSVLQVMPAASFDGKKWNVSTGNLSVSFIQASPIGAYPKSGYTMEPPPAADQLIEAKQQGLVAYEDYVAWGAVERESGKWDWTQHDKIYEAVKKAGLHYVVYNWTHFPPVWLRESKDRTLMRCVEHSQDTNYFSIFDPRTIDYYDHFYHELSRHFGDRIDGVYACILGPYGEGNYPLFVPDFINMGHCHEGYWCDDPYALSAFREAMRRKYGNISAVNTAWGGALKSFSDIRPPREIADGFKPSPAAFPAAQDRRRWLDFITWYHQAIIDFAEQSIKVTLKYFPREKVRTKPGGNAGGVNPVAWGTYCPGYAKMASAYGITLQPADCRGAYFGDKWVGTAYHYYGVRLSTEPAGGLDKKGFVRRIFSDASCGASQLFTYEWPQHYQEVRQYIHLLTGHPSDTDIAILCPTTLYRLGGDLGPTIQSADRLRDLTDYDVLDELLVVDGALTSHYKALVIFQGDYIDQPVLNKIEKWVRGGGSLIIASSDPVRGVDGVIWPFSETSAKPGRGNITRLHSRSPESLATALKPFLRDDGILDGVWTTRRGSELFYLNTTNQPATINSKSGKVQIEPGSIYEQGAK